MALVYISLARKRGYAFWLGELLQSERLDKSLCVKMAGEKVHNLSVFVFVVELEFGIGEAFVQDHIGFGGVLWDSNGWKVAAGEHFQ